MKQRFSSLDVKVIAHELSNALVTLRLANVYDLSSKIFLLKFAKPDNKQSMLIDSGFRCHLTSFSRTTAAAPSVFVARLRKFLKTRRVTSVAQVGTDRIIEFQFSDGQYRMFLEFYAGGNIILTDKELNILALLRVVPEGEAQEELRIGLKYSLENRQNYGGVPPLTKERLQDALQKATEKGDDGANAIKKKKKAGDALRRALAVSITEYPPILVDHAMRVTDFTASLKPEEVLQSEELLQHLLRSLQEAGRVVQDITSSETTTGYIFAKGKPPQEGQGGRGGLMYDDFHPFSPAQFKDDTTSTVLPFQGFNKTVDEFFSSIEGQKLESKLQEREIHAKKKLEAAREDQAKRLGGLQEVQQLNVRKAGAIEANVERVQEAMDAVNGLIAQGMDWVEIGKLIELEQKRNNAVAEIIKLPLKLHENTVTLLLGEEDFAEDEDSDSADETDSDVSDSEDELTSKKPLPKEQVDNRLQVDIVLALSPYANAREYYDQRRSAVLKEQKTLQSSSKALKNTEQKIQQELKRGLKQEKAVLRPVRRQMWFEKFLFFISSDGYLVLGGRDGAQNEILYRRYLKKGDVYLHSDVQGASVVIVKNNPSTPDAEIPPSTLSQAGTLAVASSSAWDSKAGMSAWWVNADQVSKSAPSGEFLPTGSFMVNGKKNFLPPAQLLLGFGLLFHVSDESKAKHVKHRIYDHDQSSADALGAATSEATDGNLSEEEMADESAEEDTGKDSESRLTAGRANPLQSSQNATEYDDGDAGDSPEEAEPEIEKNIETKVQNLQIDGEPSEPAPPAQEEDGTSDDEAEVRSTPAPTAPSVTSTQKGPAPAKRGKRGKAKKIAAKYKYQDEEDRLAAQELIGATAGREKAEVEAKAKAEREAEIAFQKERRRQQHQRTQKQMAEHEEVRKLMLEEGAVEDDDEAQRMTQLDSFVGTPLTGDEILDAIPVAAPWAAMGKYKYKVKLQPGSLKKGKALKEIIGKWQVDTQVAKWIDQESRDNEKMWPREVELIRALKPEECVNVLAVGKVRIMMAGGVSGQGKTAASSGKGRGKGGKKR